MNMSDLNQLRREAAEREFENYDFEDANFTDTNGWDYCDQDNSWTRTVFFERSEEEIEEDGTADTIIGSFTVVFAEGSDEVVTAYANINGADIGHRPEPSSGFRR
jgi:hypothetical protein